MGIGLALTIKLIERQQQMIGELIDKKEEALDNFKNTYNGEHKEDIINQYNFDIFALKLLLDKLSNQ